MKAGNWHFALVFRWAFALIEIISPSHLFPEVPSMFFTKWLRRRAKSRPTRAFRPSVSLLEDRIVPTGFGVGFGSPGLWWWQPPPPPGPATQLEVMAPDHVQA